MLGRKCRLSDALYRLEGLHLMLSGWDFCGSTSPATEQQSLAGAVPINDWPHMSGDTHMTLGVFPYRLFDPCHRMSNAFVPFQSLQKTLWLSEMFTCLEVIQCVRIFTESSVVQ